MSTPQSQPTPPQPSPQQPSPQTGDTPAPVEEQAAAALEIASDLMTAMEQLVDRVHQLEAGPPPGTGDRRSDYRFESYPVATTREELDEQAELVAETWHRLAVWVDWLVGLYRLTNIIPPCWPYHPALVEELASLRIAWIGAWLDDAHPDAPASWQRRLHETRTRLADGNWGVPRCTGEHDDSGLDLAASFHIWRQRAGQDEPLRHTIDRSTARLTPPTAGDTADRGPVAAVEQRAS